MPHSPAIVPSSISVTFGEATCSPTLPAYTLAPLAMASASSPWPHASWNSTPPLPRLMTTGIVPDGAGRASSFVVAIRAASRASASTSTRSNVSNPTVWPTDWKPVCIPVSPSATTLMRDMQRVIESSVSTPSVLATRTSLRLSAYDADTCTTDLPDERAASSIAPQQLDLGRLRHAARIDLDVVDVVPCGRVEGDRGRRRPFRCGPPRRPPRRRR